ncbi:MAG TPA: T9SS type A sorting domain-containing protein, partial [Chitinophagales bacterium]|nr:T9SS type A sorting domain-containing protein [Chitinophagales bacterium]
KTNCTESGSSNSGFTSIQTFTTTLRLGSGSVSTEEMMSIYPNPAKDHATIQFTLQQSSHVYISMYDISGKEIETLMNDHAEQGDHSVQLNTDQFSKGIYFVKMISDFGIENVKLVVQ